MVLNYPTLEHFKLLLPTPCQDPIMNHNELLKGCQGIKTFHDKGGLQGSATKNKQLEAIQNVNIAHFLHSFITSDLSVIWKYSIDFALRFSNANII